MVPPAARFTRWSTQLAARSQAPLPPDTTSEALLTQDELARSDELCELQQQEGSCWSQVIRLQRIYFSKHFCPCFGL